MAEPVRARRLTDEEGHRLTQIVRRGGDTRSGSPGDDHPGVVVGHCTAGHRPAMAVQANGSALHFTPTGSSWVNQVERWFGFLTDQEILESLVRFCRRISGAGHQ
jgi:hypothetical protein